MPFKCNKLLLTVCFANVLVILLSICHVAHDVSMLQEESVHDASADFFQSLISALEKHLGDNQEWGHTRACMALGPRMGNTFELMLHCPKISVG